MLFQKAIDAGYRLDVPVRPDAGITGGDPAFRRNRAGFGHDQTRAAHRPRTQMHQVPVRRRSAHGRILAATSSSYGVSVPETMPIL